MNRNSLFLLPLAIASPIEKLGYVFLILFFITQFVLFLLKKNTFEFDITIIKHPIIILFFSTMLFVKLRNPIGNWDRDLALLFMPIFFGFRKFNKDEVYVILKWFVYFLGIGLIASILYEITLEFYFNDFLNEWKLIEYYKNNRFLFLIHSVSERIDFHHIYLSLYLFFGFIIAVWLLNQDIIKNRKERLLLGILMILFFSFCFLSISRMTIICFVIYFFGVFLYSIKTTFLRNIIIKTVLLFLGVIFFVFSNNFSDRFKKINEDPRGNLFQISYNLADEALIFGYGSETGSELFINEQKKAGHTVLYSNPHNQYLDYLLTGGIVMLVVFLITLFLIFKRFINNKLYIGAILIFFFMLQCMTEALMERYRGIVLFAFFVSLFYGPRIKKELIIS
ncbi:MAG: O-antigen ligase family protein [Gelidibacter sp.]